MKTITYYESDLKELQGRKFESIEEVEKAEVKGGAMDGKVLSVNDVKALAKLPSKEELYAKMLGCINSPATGIVGGINGVMAALVRAIDQVRQQKTA